MKLIKKEIESCDSISVQVHPQWGYTHSYAVAEAWGEDGVIASRKTRIPNATPSRGGEFEWVMDSAGQDLCHDIEQGLKKLGVKINVYLESEFGLNPTHL
jgi:hypothetical protein